jgi:hypothetical protein
MVKGFFDFFNCPGRKAGYLGWAAAVPEKLISVFIITTQGRSSKRILWLKAFSIFLTAQGGRLAISDGLHQCRENRYLFLSLLPC